MQRGAFAKHLYTPLEQHAKRFFTLFGSRRLIDRALPAQTPMIVVTGSNIAATFQGVYRAVASPTGGEFAYVNLHGRRLFKSIDDCWCLKNMTVNDDGVRSVNGRGSAPNRRRFYCGRHLGTDGTIVGDNVKGGSLYGRCGPDGGSEQCHSCQRYQSDHSAWFRSAAMPTGTRTWNYNSKTGPFQIPEIVVDPSRPLEVSLTLARCAAAVTSPITCIVIRKCQRLLPTWYLQIYVCTN